MKLKSIHGSATTSKQLTGEGSNFDDLVTMAPVERCDVSSSEVSRKLLMWMC